MIDRFSSHWKEACELIDYTYPEDLDSWVNSSNGIIDIASPVLDKIFPGDVIFINSLAYSYCFLFSMLRSAILDYTPLAMLSTFEEDHAYLNEMLFSFFDEELESDEKVIERLAARAILSKRIRAKRFCEFEDESATLADKGYRTIIIDAALPRLDAESIEKGYVDRYDALKKVAIKYGLSFIVITSTSRLPVKVDGITTLKVWPVRNRFLFAPPEELTVTVNGERQYRFHIENDSGIIAGFSIGGREVLLVRKDEGE